MATFIEKSRPLGENYEPCLREEMTDLCTAIALQPEMSAAVMEFMDANDTSSLNEMIVAMGEQETAESAYKQLTATLGDDPKCLRMLACQLLCAVYTRRRYRTTGIDDKVFVDTMRCFTRFINECKEKTGQLAFDRGWWTYRQLSMMIFRLGELEFEFRHKDTPPAVHIHIPSDASLATLDIDESLRMARSFIESHLPEFSSHKFMCHSWLMSPVLKELLRSGSNISAFQDRFDIISFDSTDTEFIEWLFKVTPGADISSLKEDTSLQRKAKQLLLAGKGIGSGVGVLNE